MTRTACCIMTAPLHVAADEGLTFTLTQHWSEQQISVVPIRIVNLHASQPTLMQSQKIQLRTAVTQSELKH